MPSNYPTSLDSFATGALTGLVSGSDHGNKADALNKIEAELGTSPSGVAATVTARLASLPISVKDHGATGDGTTNDRAAVAAAIDAINAAGGGVLTFPEGIYKIDTALPQITAPILLQGAGAGIVPATFAGTVVKFAAGVGGFDLSAAAQYSTIRDIYMESLSTGVGSDHGITTLAHAAEISGVVIDGFGGSGVHMDTTASGNANNSVLKRVRVTDVKGNTTATAAFFIKGVNSNVVTLDHCDASDNAGWGYRMENVAQCVLVAPHGAVNALGFYYDNGNTNHVYNPYSESGTGHAATLAGSYGYWLSGSYADPTLTISNPNTNTVYRQGGFERNLRIQDVAASGKTYKLATGEYAAGAFSLTNLTDSRNILDIDGAGTRFELLTALRLGISGSFGGFMEVPELAADAAAPGTNTARVYTKDNGSGKTQLVVRFNTGAVQVIATEP